MVVSGVFVVSLLIGGSVSAAYASDNDDFYDNYEATCSSPYLADYVEDICNDMKRVRDSEAATAVSYGVLLAYSYIQSVHRKWDTQYPLIFEVSKLT